MTASIKRGLICAFILLATVFCLSAAIAEGEAYMAKVTVSKMYIRSEADSGSEVLGYLAKGKQFTVIDVQDGIAYIEYNGRTGYAKVSDMSKVSDAIGTAVVNENSFKIYASPSVDSEVIATVNKGASFVLVAKTSTWAKLQNGRNIGYAPLIGLTFVQAPAATPTPVPSATPDVSWASRNATPETAEVTADVMTVRGGPTGDYSVLGTLSKGLQINVHAVRDGIAYIEYNGKFGFCRTSDYKTIKPEYRTATITASTLKIYASATTSSKVLATVKKGNKFTVLDYDNTWVKLQNGSNIGYAKRSGVSLSVIEATPAPSASVIPTSTVTAAPTATPKPTATPTPSPSVIPQTISVAAFANKDAKVYQYASTKSSVLYSVKAGAEFTVLGINDSFALINTSSGKGYITVSAVTKVSDVTLGGSGNTPATVKTDNLKFYKYASTISSYLGSLKKGTQVTILAYNDSWAHVSYNGKKGYCKLSGLNLTQMPTIAQTESKPGIVLKSAKLYKYAINTSNVLGTMSANGSITVLGHDDIWALVQYGSKIGYVQKVYITLVSDVTISENQNYYANVITGGTVYKYAYSTAASAGSVSKGTLITVLGQKNGWALIQKGSNKGYMPLSSLSIIYDEFVSPTNANYSGTVVKKTYLYKMALESSDKLTSIGLGVDLTVTQETSKWAKVTYNGQTGYVLKNTLSTTSYTELKSGTSTGTSVTTLQKKLEDLGYFDGLPAANYGSLTLNAVKRFQTEIGIEATGVATVATLRVLYSGNAPASPIKSVSLSNGSVGSNVTRLQTRLTYKGYMSGSLDGDYGNITAKAVKAYQKAAGLPETGTADAATMASLFSSSAPTNTSSETATSPSHGTAGTGKWSTDPDDDPAPGTGSEKIEIVIEYALAQLGKPYVYGTSGTKSFDCSGFTGYCYKKVGVSLGRSAYAQGYNNVGTKIEGVKNLIRGDLVCLNTLSDNDLSDHVGIYLGGGKFIHASSSAAKVIISSIDSGYYYRVFSWGRRLL